MIDEKIMEEAINRIKKELDGKTGVIVIITNNEDFHIASNFKNPYDVLKGVLIHKKLDEIIEQVDDDGRKYRESLN